VVHVANRVANNYALDLLIINIDPALRFASRFIAPHDSHIALLHALQAHARPQAGGDPAHYPATRTNLVQAGVFLCQIS